MRRHSQPPAPTASGCLLSFTSTLPRWHVASKTCMGCPPGTSPTAPLLPRQPSTGGEFGSCGCAPHGVPCFRPLLQFLHGSEIHCWTLIVILSWNGATHVLAVRPTASRAMQQHPPKGPLVLTALSWATRARAPRWSIKHHLHSDVSAYNSTSMVPTGHHNKWPHA